MKWLFNRQGKFPIRSDQSRMESRVIGPKKFPALHERIATQMNDMINNEMDIPKWMKTLRKK